MKQLIRSFETKGFETRSDGKCLVLLFSLIFIFFPFIISLFSHVFSYFSCFFVAFFLFLLLSLLSLGSSSLIYLNNNLTIILWFYDYLVWLYSFVLGFIHVEFVVFNQIRKMLIVIFMLETLILFVLNHFEDKTMVYIVVDNL